MTKDEKKGAVHLILLGGLAGWELTKGRRSAGKGVAERGQRGGRKYAPKGNGKDEKEKKERAKGKGKRDL